MVTSLHKDGETNEPPNNYRPISVIPVVIKIFERAVHQQVYQYLSTNHLLSPHQSGFRPGHSTTTCLLEVSDYILKNMDQGCTTGAVFLDLSKAFDLINHTTLLAKLSSIGIRNNELNWFTDYLANRTQTVKINGCKSDPMNIKTGVPQGSVLGPLLFIICINDLPEHVPKSKVVLYADDTALFFANKESNTIQSVMQNDLTHLSNWFTTNGLVVNGKKSNVMLFGTSQRLAKVEVPSLKISESSLKPQKSIGD